MNDTHISDRSDNAYSIKLRRMLDKAMDDIGKQYITIKQLEQKIAEQEKVIRKLAGKIKGCPDGKACLEIPECEFVECWRAWAEKGGINE